jgi:hypothetical protein
MLVTTLSLSGVTPMTERSVIPNDASAVRCDL